MNGMIDPMKIYFKILLQIKARVIASGIMALMLAGCASYGAGGLPGPNLPGRGGAGNFAAGSGLGVQLNRAERSALEDSFLSAMATRKPGVAQNWQVNRGAGSVTAGGYFIANLMPHPETLMRARTGLDLSYRLETEQGAYVLARNANIRFGPSTDFEIVETLPSGTGVEGIGRVEGATWMLISVGDVVRGYVFEPLIVKAPGAGALELAGGPVRQPYLCRGFTQSLTLRGQRDRWQGTACDYGEGWELVKRAGPTLLGE